MHAYKVQVLLTENSLPSRPLAIRVNDKQVALVVVAEMAPVGVTDRAVVVVIDRVSIAGTEMRINVRDARTEVSNLQSAGKGAHNCLK